MMITEDYYCPPVEAGLDDGAWSVVSLSSSDLLQLSDVCAHCLQY